LGALIDHHRHRIAVAGSSVWSCSMHRLPAPPAPWPDLSRRRFVQGLVTGGVMLGLGWPNGSSAQPRLASLPNEGAAQTDFTLDVGSMPVNFCGASRQATTINGSLPGPTLRMRQGSTVTLRVRNHLSVPTSIHWHGILLPFQMDGVPGLSYAGIAPGETFVYRFPLRQSGTYWYHSHSGFQEQTGLYGALVIEPDGPPRQHADRDYVVMLNDWTDEAPAHVMAMLKKQSDHYSSTRPTIAGLLRDAGRDGLGRALAERRMWNRMRMQRGDLADVTGLTYTYLMNGVSPNGNWTGLFRRGERLRLRFINGSAMSIFDVRIPGLKMTVVAADGQDVEPVSVDEFRISVAETYDVIVEPADDHAYTVFAQSIDRSGYARGTLAPAMGMQAAVPVLDPASPLTMGDMMGAAPMSMSSGHAGHAVMPDMPPGDPMHDMHDMYGSMVDTPMTHAAKASSVGVDMRVATPRDTIDDPGVGLRGNGRRVLSYADLHTIGGSLDAREPAREIELHLTGNMQRYMWSFDGVSFADAPPVRFQLGERLRIVLVNDTMMNHPIHLHGMWSELQHPDGSFQVRKHTINVQPAQRVSYDVTANAPGRWAYHCHMLYHMEAGMMREVVVA
jgi:CopA family copper-resistance protein